VRIVHLARSCAVVLVLAGCIAPSATAADQPPLKVGFLASFSGPYADQNKDTDAAIAAFIKEHGEGVAGRRLQIIKRDDGGLAPENARRLAQDLIVGDHVDFLMGLTLSPNAIAMAPIATQAKVPTLLVNAGAYGVLEKSPYFARFSFTTGQETYPLADYALKHGFKNVYIIVTQFSSGIDAADTFRTAFTAGGGQIAGEVQVPVGSTDFSAYIQRIRDAKPHAVFAFLTVSGVPFLKAWYSQGGPQTGIKILATGDLTKESSLPALGDAAAGVITAQNYSLLRKSPANDAFIRDMHAADSTSLPADFFTAATYDVLQAIYTVTAKQNGSIDADKTMALLKGLKLEGPRGPIEIDPATRDCIQNIYIHRVDKVGDGYQNTLLATYPMVRDPVEK